MPETVSSTLSTLACLILTAKPQSGPCYHLHITDQETEAHGGERAHSGSQLSRSGSESTPDSSDSTASPLNCCTMLPFIHISTQEIFTYWLIGSLSTLMLPRLLLCVAVCDPQLPILLNNISIIPSNNFASGDGDLQTANCPEGGWKLKIGAVQMFLRSGSCSVPHCGRCIFSCCWACGERAILPDYREWSRPWDPESGCWALSLPPQPQNQRANRHWWHLRIDAYWVGLMLWQ